MMNCIVKKVYFIDGIKVNNDLKMAQFTHLDFVHFAAHPADGIIAESLDCCRLRRWLGPL